MTHYKRLFACAPACAIVACRDAMAPHGTPSDLNGEWTEDFSHTSVAGDGFFVSLNESAGVVTGQGAYSAEAGPNGFLEISGMARGDAVHLSISTRRTRCSLK